MEGSCRSLKKPLILPGVIADWLGFITKVGKLLTALGVGMGKSLIRPCRCRSLRQHTRRYSSLYLGVQDGTRAMPRSSMLRSPLANELKGPCFRWSFIEFPLEFCNRNDGPEVANTSKKRSNLRHFKLLGKVV